MYCHAIALIELKNYDNGHTDLSILIKDDPNDEGIRSAYQNVSVILCSKNEKETGL